MSRWPAKLTQRRVSGAIDRERLFALLGDGSVAPLIWIEGPAGAGKTVLASTWLARIGRPALWYRVDESDVGIATYLSYLAQGAGLLTRKQSLKLPVPTRLAALDEPEFARRFFRHFFAALPQRAAVVFDAVETAPDAALLDQLLLHALAELPSTQCLIVTARNRPNTALAHLPAAGAMSRIGWDDLRLTADEAEAIAGGLGAVTPASVHRLHQATDGWAAGFVVLLAHAKRNGLSREPADAAELFPYYLNELFERTEESTQALLMRTAVLPAFSAAQAIALVPPGADVEGVLRRLVRHHFFIEQGRGVLPVYRYHALFREFLLEQGRARLAPGDRSALLRQAAELSSAAAEPEAALALLIEAQAWPDAVRRIRELAPHWLEQGRGATLENAIGGLPAAALERDPWLQYWLARARLDTQTLPARAGLERACATFEQRREVHGQVLACAGLVESYIVEWGDLQPIDRWGDLLRDLLAEHGAGLPAPIELHALSKLSVLMFRGSRHAALVEAGRLRALAMIERLAHGVPQLAVANFVCLVHYLRGEWHAGLQFLADTEVTLRPASALPMQRAVRRTLEARLLVWAGRPQDAIDIAADAEQLAAEHQLRDLMALAASASVFAAINADQPARAAAALERMRANVVPHRTLDRAGIAFHAGVVALAEGNAEAASEGLRVAVRLAAGCGADLLAAHYRVVLALASIELGHHAAAAAELDLVGTDAAEAALPVLDHARLTVAAWLALRDGRRAEALELLAAALALGRERGYRTVFPWVPVTLMRDLGQLALEHALEPAQARAWIALRRVPPPADAPDAWPWRVRVFALGRFDVLIDGEPVRMAAKAPRKPLELLKVLVALGGTSRQGVPLGWVGVHLWPDLDGAATQNAFNVALHRLRRRLGDDNAVVLREGRLFLDPARVWTDVSAFESLAQRIETDADAGLQRRVFDLYLGPLLPEVEQPWATAARQRLHSRFSRAVTALADRHEQSQQRDQLHTLLQQAIEVDPLAEAFHRRLMLCLQSEGRHAEALAAYRRCCELLRSLLGTSPSEQTERLAHASSN